MEAGITVKEEIIIDDQENEQVGIPVKEELDQGDFETVGGYDSFNIKGDELNIIEERPDMITIRIGELRSEDERNFIASLGSSEIILKGCEMQSESFRSAKSLMGNKRISESILLKKDHFKCNLCLSEFKCNSDLHKHQTLHKQNVHFCTRGCSKYFQTLEECLDHEDWDHLNTTDRMKCRVCHESIIGKQHFAEHMKTHSYVRRYVCSLCRNTFRNSSELSKHWEVSPGVCGLMKCDPMALTRVAENVLTISDAENSDEIMPFKRIKLSKPNNQDSQILKHVDIKEEPLTDENNLLNLYSNDIRDSEDVVIKTEQLTNDENIEFVNMFCSTATTDTIATTPIFPDVSKLRLPSIKKPKDTKQANQFEDKSISKAGPGVVNKDTEANMKANVKIEVLDPESLNQPKNIVNLGNVEQFEKSQNKSVSSLIIRKIPQNNSTKSQNIGSESLVESNKNMQNKVNCVSIADNSIMKGCRIIHLPPNTKICAVPAKPNNLPSASQQNTVIKKVPSNIRLIHLPANTKIVPIGPVKRISVPTDPNSVNTESGKRTALVNVTTKRPSHIVSSQLEAGEKFSVETVAASNRNPVVLGSNGEEIQVGKDPKPSRSLCFTSGTMSYIENLPRSRKVIETLKNKIRIIEETSPIPVACSVLAKDEEGKSLNPNKLPPPTTDTQNENEDSNGSEDNQNGPNMHTLDFQLDSEKPTSLYLQVSNTNNQQLTTLRKTYMDYRFAWMCPQCPRQYELKYSFRNHLTIVHGITPNVYEKLVVELKPFKLINPVDVRKSETIRDIDTSKDTSEKPTEAKNTFEEVVTTSSTEFMCQKCCTSFISLDLLTEHTKKNCSRMRIHKCPDCSKRFYSTSTLNCHRTIHTGELPHKCNYCDKRFRTRGQVTVHHRTHTGERPFTCEVCSLSFTHRETLISHLSRHIGMKRYKCYGCEKHFSCISGLRTHRDVRPDTCGRVKFSPRAIGPRVRVVRGKVIFEQQPVDNPYLRSEDPKVILTDIQNQH